MQGIIPENILDEIRLKVDIIELIGGLVPLKGAGRNYKALCPFHPEKSPSFMVNSEKQIFHCFGCGAGGNIFTFLMKFENISFPEAVETLAEKAGVTLPKQGLASAGVEYQKKSLFEVTEKVCQFFEKMLLTSPLGQEGRNYLKSRGMDRKTAEAFRLGFCPIDEATILKELKALGVQENLLEKVGLITEHEQGKHFRFRGRVIFPIFDVQGRIVGFGGRALGERMPKYLNSPDTVLFNKSNLLYGLHLAKRSILEKSQAILVEGYIDVISVFRSGVENVVASLGTAFNENHVRLIRRFAQEIVVAYDGDDAGLEASLRALEVFLDQDMIVKIVKIPDGHDPDSFIRAKGKEAFEKLISQAGSMMDFKIELLSKKFNSQTESGKLTIAREVLKTIGRLKSSILQDHYFKELSEKLKINEQALRQELKRGGLIKINVPQKPIPVPEKDSGHDLEEDLLRILLHNNELILEIKEKIRSDDFEVQEYKSLFERMLGSKKILKEEEKIILETLEAKLLIEKPEIKDIQGAFNKYIIALKERSYRKEYQSLNQKLKEIEKSGRNQGQMDEIVSELQKIHKAIALLKKV